MTPEAILRHLYTYLPKHTNLFHKNITDVETVSAVSAQVIEVVTTGSHLLEEGDIVGMSGALVPTPIIGVNVDDATIEILTGISTDLTQGYHSECILGGFTNTAMNTTHTISQVLSPYQVDIVKPDTVSSITLSGGEYVLSNRELLDGVFNITEIVDARTFRFEIPDTLPIGLIFGATLYANMRIYGVLQASDALRAYTKQDRTVMTPLTDDGPYLVFFMGEEMASKDPKISSDALSENRNLSYARQLYTQPFTILVVLDSTHSRTGIQAQNIIYNEVRQALRKIWHNYVFPADENVSQVYGVTEVSNSFYAYDGAVYIHGFNYQIPYTIIFEQGFRDAPSVSLEKVYGDIYYHTKGLSYPVQELDNKMQIDIDL